MNNLTRFVLYARKSSEREDRQVQSIDDQIAFWKKKAKEEGVEIIKIYTEEKSAKTPYVRKEFQRMCDDISKGGIDGVLCWKLDRLSRNPIDTGAIQYMLQRGMIGRIITSDRLYYPEDSGLIFSVETGMANQYILDLSKNVKRGLGSKIEKGQFPGKAPQGYTNDPISRTILRDEARYTLVRKMWDLLLTGCYAPSKIAEIANTEWGFTTYKTPRGGGTRLALSTLYAIFKNPFYAGYFLYNGKIKKGSHEAMISWEEYEKVQSLINHTKANPNALHTERPSILSFAYTGSVKCGCCGCMITAVKKYKTLKTTGEVRDYTYYHCTHKKDSPDFKCDQRNVISSVLLEEQITKILQSIEIVPEFFDWAKGVLQRRHGEETLGRETVYESVNKALESEEKKKNRLIQMRLNGEFDDNYSEYDRLKSEMEKNIENFQIKRQELEVESINWTDLMEKAFDFAQYAGEKFHNGDIDTKKMIFRSLGWNWILKDGKINANLHDWLLPFVKFKQEQLSPLQRLEPTEKGISFGRSDALIDGIPVWWGYLGLNQGPIGYACYYSFRYPFRVGSLDYPFILIQDVCHLVSTPSLQAELGSGLPCPKTKVSPNLTDKHYEIALITALVNFSYFAILSVMKCIICGKVLSGKQKLFCSVSCKNQKHQSYPSQKARGFKRKRELVERFGGCCMKCGYKRNLGALSFHHTNPQEKEFKLDVRSLSNRTIERIEQEVKSCVLLCHNCHAEEHYPELNLEKVI